MAQKKPARRARPKAVGTPSAAPHAPPLLRTARGAKWVDSPETHADRPGQSLATRNHEVIFGWAEARGARPAAVDDGEVRRALRFEFPRYNGVRLTPIGWDEWFRTFDGGRLVFLFQERKKDGTQSNFFRLDAPPQEDG